MIRELVTVAFILVGLFFLAVGTVGLLRLPGVYNRMHATSKATTLGAASIFLAGFVHFGPQGGGLVSLVGIVFLFVTAPTGAHMISRSARRMGIDFVPGADWPAGEADPVEKTGDGEDVESTGDGEDGGTTDEGDDEEETNEGD